MSKDETVSDLGTFYGPWPIEVVMCNPPFDLAAGSGAILCEMKARKLTQEGEAKC